MKKTLLALSLLVAGIAIAVEPPKPLITKSSGGGYMMAEVAGGETCNIYQNQVQIIHRLGMHVPTALVVNETRAASVSGNIELVIANAANEKVEQKPNMMCDGPSTTITAGDLLLYSTGGCGSPKQERMGVNSSKLREIAGYYCPRTFNFSHDNE